MTATMRRPLIILLVTLVLLFSAAAGSKLPAALADSEPHQIRSAKIEWLTPDSVEDGQANRLFIREYYSNSDASMQFEITIVLTGQEPHEPGSVRILFPRQIWHQRSTYYADGTVNTQQG